MIINIHDVRLIEIFLTSLSKNTTNIKNTYLKLTEQIKQSFFVFW